MTSLTPTLSNDPDRIRVRAKIAQMRGGAVSPFFECLLECPAVAEAASDLGGQLRFSGKLPPRLREFAICTVASHWRAEYEWTVHSDLAVKAGITSEVLNAVRLGSVLPATDDAVRAVYAFMMEVLRDGRASASSRNLAIGLLGQSQTIELLAIAGYFSFLAFVINTFE